MNITKFEVPVFSIKYLQLLSTRYKFCDED